MIVDLGKTPSGRDQLLSYKVLGRIYSEKENDYVAVYTAGTFNSYAEAFDIWDEWEPPKTRIDEFMKMVRAADDTSHYELEIGMYCDELADADLPMMNITLDPKGEVSKNV